MAYPDRVLKARISNILPIIDPNIRTAKVRLEVENPGLMRLGMFVTATFHGETAEKHATVPATRDSAPARSRVGLYAARATGRFRRVGSGRAGACSPDNMQEVISGIKPGDQVIANALVFQNTVEQ